MRERAQRTNNLTNCHPLIEWGMTEADCLKYCYEHGIDFGGVYKNQKRASCWCCPLQSIDALRGLYHNYPDLWKRLEEMDKKAIASPLGYKFLFHNRRVADFSERFAREDRAKKCQKSLDDF